MIAVGVILYVLGWDRALYGEDRFERILGGAVAVLGGCVLVYAEGHL